MLVEGFSSLLPAKQPMYLGPVMRDETDEWLSKPVQALIMICNLQHVDAHSGLLAPLTEATSIIARLYSGFASTKSILQSFENLAACSW